MPRIQTAIDGQTRADISLNGGDAPVGVKKLSPVQPARRTGRLL